MKKAKDYILFSPLGDTDPIRGCYDGACLHIIRHYHPKSVFLFFTKDMADKERKDQRYTRAIRKLDPKIDIQCKMTDIINPQQYDCFNREFPELVRSFHEMHKQSQLLLNLSSGTPQMKTVLAILATEYDWCTGIQVYSPENGSNRKNIATRDDEDIAALLENNFDDLGAENRCNEPPLHVIRFYREKNQILSLIDEYEYKGAYEISRHSCNITDDVKRLLQHAYLRSSLLFDEAARVISHWQGNKLILQDKEMRNLLEYYYLMKVAQEKGRLPELMVKISPFLFEYLLAYVKKNDTGNFLSQYCIKNNGRYKVVVTNLPSALQSFFNQAFGESFRGGDLSFRYLGIYCKYMLQEGLAKDTDMHNELMSLAIMDDTHVRKLGNLRNEAAHTIVDIDESKFVRQIGLSSSDVVREIGKMLVILYKQDNIVKSIYNKINSWIKKELQVPAES